MSGVSEKRADVPVPEGSSGGPSQDGHRLTTPASTATTDLTLPQASPDASWPSGPSEPASPYPAPSSAQSAGPDHAKSAQSSSPVTSSPQNEQSQQRQQLQKDTTDLPKSDAGGGDESRKRSGSPSNDPDAPEKRRRNEVQAQTNTDGSQNGAAKANTPLPTNLTGLSGSVVAAQMHEHIAHCENAHKLDLYVWEYLYRRKLFKTAASLIEETDLPENPEVPVRLPGGLLYEYWSVFWELFSTRVGYNSQQANIFAEFIESRRKNGLQESTRPKPMSSAVAESSAAAATVADVPGVIAPLGAPTSIAPGIDLRANEADSSSSLMMPAQDNTNPLAPALPMFLPQAHQSQSSTQNQAQSHSPLPPTPSQSVQTPQSQVNAATPQSNTHTSTPRPLSEQPATQTQQPQQPGASQISGNTPTPSGSHAPTPTPTGTSAGGNGSSQAPPPQVRTMSSHAQHMTPRMQQANVSVSTPIPGHMQQQAPQQTPQQPQAPMHVPFKVGQTGAVNAANSPMLHQQPGGLPGSQSQQQQQQQQPQQGPQTQAQAAQAQAFQMQMQQAFARAQMGQNLNMAALTPQQQQQLLMTAALRQGIAVDELKNMTPASRLALLQSAMQNMPAQNAAAAAMSRADPQLQARLFMQQQQQQQQQNMLFMQQMQSQAAAAGKGDSVPGGGNAAAFQALFQRPPPRATPGATPMPGAKNGDGVRPNTAGLDAAGMQSVAAAQQAMAAGRGMMPFGRNDVQANGMQAANTPAPFGAPAGMTQLSEQLSPQQRQMLILQYQALQTAIKNEWMKAQTTNVPGIAQQGLATAQQMQVKAQLIMSLLNVDPSQSMPFNGENHAQVQQAQAQLLQHLQQQQHQQQQQHPHQQPQTHQAQHSHQASQHAQPQAQMGQHAQMTNLPVGMDAAALLGQSPQFAQKMGGPMMAQHGAPPGTRPDMDMSNGANAGADAMHSFFSQPMGVQQQQQQQQQQQAMMNGLVTSGMTRGSATAPTTPVTAHATPQTSSMSNKGGRLSTNRPSAGGAPSGRATTEVPPSPWQPSTPHASESPSGTTGKRDTKPRRQHARSASTKTPLSQYAQADTSASGDRPEDAAVKDESQDWDKSTKSDSGFATQLKAAGGPGNNAGSNQTFGRSSTGLGMPSLMDDMTSGSLASTSGPGQTDEISAMFGVSDIFDFDFDGGDNGSNASGGDLGKGGAGDA